MTNCTKCFSYSIKWWPTPIHKTTNCTNSLRCPLKWWPTPIHKNTNCTNSLRCPLKWWPTPIHKITNCTNCLAVESSDGQHPSKRLLSVLTVLAVESSDGQHPSIRLLIVLMVLRCTVLSVHSSDNLWITDHTRVNHLTAVLEQIAGPVTNRGLDRVTTRMWLAFSFKSSGVSYVNVSLRGSKTLFSFLDLLLPNCINVDIQFSI